MDLTSKPNNDSQALENNIEALLFYYNESTSIKKLSKVLKCSESEVESALKNLKSKHDGSGLQIIYNSREAQLVALIADEDIVESLGESARNIALSDASKETLSIILYLENPTESMIDSIRGVKSARIIKKLIRQGYIKMVDKDLTLTTDAMLQLGISDTKQLEDMDVIRMKLQSLANAV